MVVLEERTDNVSGFLDLEAVADDREDGGRRGGRVELRYALAEKFGERNGASTGSDRREEVEVEKGVGVVVGGDIGVILGLDIKELAGEHDVGEGIYLNALGLIVLSGGFSVRLVSPHPFQTQCNFYCLLEHAKRVALCVRQVWSYAGRLFVDTKVFCSHGCVLSPICTRLVVGDHAWRQMR